MLDLNEIITATDECSLDEFAIEPVNNLARPSDYLNDWNIDDDDDDDIFSACGIW